MFRMQKRAVTPPASVSGMASVYISGKEDATRRHVFDHPGLRAWRHRQLMSSP
jgi:hypothetical protein